MNPFHYGTIMSCALDKQFGVDALKLHFIETMACQHLDQSLTNAWTEVVRNIPPSQETLYVRSDSVTLR